jgi:hypothetical protein
VQRAIEKRRVLARRNLAAVAQGDHLVAEIFVEDRGMRGEAV